MKNARIRLSFYFILGAGHKNTEILKILGKTGSQRSTRKSGLENQLLLEIEFSIHFVFIRIHGPHFGFFKHIKVIENRRLDLVQLCIDHLFRRLNFR